ncbi:MAG: sigma-70 family RNA polymerase sigma factor [Pirellulales bacterium]|nr:sigma-70 family RNA polymerase sigma factor [Pirellulales bacterium]
MSAPTDESLMVEVSRGDLAAFEQLVLRHQQAVWQTAYRMVGDSQAAEDLAQEAFLRIFRAAGGYRPTAKFRTYLYRVVSRLCLDYLAKNRPVLEENLSRVAGPDANVEEQAVIEEQSHEVRQAIAGLPAQQRSAIVLRYYEGLSIAEIAEAIETTPKAVERLLARGRAGLEKRLK